MNTKSRRRDETSTSVPNAKSLELLVKKSGILLEHEVHHTLTSFAARIGTPLGDGISYQAKLKMRVDGEDLIQDIEVDVTTGFRQSQLWLSPQYMATVAGRGQLRTYTVTELSTYIYAECKGHEPNGFLLAHLLQPASGQNHFEQNHHIRVRDADHPQLVCALRQDRYLVSKNANFYSKAGEAVPVEFSGAWAFQESKDKFRTAVRQTLNNIAFALDSIGKIPRGTRLDGPSRILPLIVTNAPIIGMRRENERVSFYNLPWFVLHNIEHPFSGVTAYHQEYDSFQVCTFSKLEEFLSLYAGNKESAFKVEIESLSSPISTIDLRTPDGQLRDLFIGSDANE